MLDPPGKCLNVTLISYFKDYSSKCLNGMKRDNSNAIKNHKNG